MAMVGGEDSIACRRPKYEGHEDSTINTVIIIVIYYLLL